MNELIKITTNEEGKRLVSAKELYLGLGLNKSNWAKWFNKNIINNEFFLEHKDWEGFVFSTNGNETTDFAISIDFAKHIAMMARTEKSHEYRNYFIECEKKLKEVTTPKLPQTYKESLIELVKTIEEKERIEEEKNKLIHQSKLYTATEIAKEVGFRSAKAFNKDLEEKKIQYKCNNTWVLNARYSELGYVSIKQIELDNGRIIYDRKFTGKGRDWLINNIYNKSVDNNLKPSTINIVR